MLSRDLGTVPTELLRALVCVYNCGGVTQAARALNLTQGDVRDQLEQLQQLLGLEVFEKSNGQGMHLTKQGLVILNYSRRILAMNDYLLSLSGLEADPVRVRVGLPAWLPGARLIEIVKACRLAYEGDVYLSCDKLEALMRDLDEGRLDVMFSCDVTGPPGTTVAAWLEPLYWISSPGFELKKNAPIPIVTWAGSLTDRMAAQLLTPAGIEYVACFSSPDYSSRIAAVAAGVGLMLTTERGMTGDVAIARDSRLPKPPMMKTGLYVRDSLDRENVEPLLRVIEKIMRPRLAVARESHDADERRAGHGHPAMSSRS